jgi:hypothetical protein
MAKSVSRPVILAVVGTSRQMGCLYMGHRRRFSLFQPPNEEPPSTQPFYMPEVPESMDNHLCRIAQMSPQDMESVLGPQRIRSTQIEAAVRMLADYFLVYDAMDRVFLDEQFNREFGGERRAARSDDIIEVDRGLLNSLDSPMLHKAHQSVFKEYGVHNIKDLEHYMETGYGAPQYSVTSPNHAYTALNRYMKKFRPGFFKGLSEQLMSADGVPNLRAFHLIIRQLTLYRYTKPAQMALDCLFLSDIPLSLETLALALKNAECDGDKSRFRRLARILQFSPSTTTDSPRLKDMSSVIRSRPRWLKRTDKQETMLKRFLPQTDRHQPWTMPTDLALLTNLFEGLCTFAYFEEADVVLRQMITHGIPLNGKILRVNFQTAIKLEDSNRARWTFNELKILVRDNSRQKLPLDVFVNAIKAADKTNNKALMTEVTEFVDREVPEGIVDGMATTTPLLNRMSNLENSVKSSLSGAFFGNAVAWKGREL